MARLLLAVVLAAAVALVAAWLQRRRPGAGPVVDRHHVPTALDRADFTRPDADWLVVVFTSATCGTCAATWEVARQLSSSAVAGRSAWRLSSERNSFRSGGVSRSARRSCSMRRPR